MENEKTIKLDFIRHPEKVKNRTSKEVGRMKYYFYFKSESRIGTSW